MDYLVKMKSHLMTSEKWIGSANQVMEVCVYVYVFCMCICICVYACVCVLVRYVRTVYDSACAYVFVSD